MPHQPIVAADVGGTRLRVALVRDDGTVTSKRVVPTPPDEPAALPDMMRRLLQESGESTDGAVVGVPGPLDYSTGRPLRLPNLRGWEGGLSAAGLTDEMGFPVLLANDADLAALGEHRFGAGAGSQDMVYVTSSTGVGAGVVVAGRLLHGRLSLAELGHTIIDRDTRDTVEGLGSGTALTRLAGEDGAQVTARALCGDEDALRYLSTVAKDFAIGVFNLVHCFMPEVAVIGGGMSPAGELLLEPIREMFTKCSVACVCSEVRVVRASGGDDVGLRGAAAYWADRRG